MPNFPCKKPTKSLQSRKLKLKSKLLHLLAKEEWESALSNPLDTALASEDEDAIMELSSLVGKETGQQMRLGNGGV
jgi:hypothetical protein